MYINILKKKASGLINIINIYCIIVATLSVTTSATLFGISGR